MLDLDKLHEDFGEKTGRCSGRTVDMLIEALHETGANPLVSVVARHMVHAEQLAGEFLRLANELGYEVKKVSRSVVRVSNPDDERMCPTTFDFQPKGSFSRRFGSTEEVFTDHFTNA